MTADTHQKYLSKRKKEKEKKRHLETMIALNIFKFESKKELILLNLLECALIMIRYGVK